MKPMKRFLIVLAIGVVIFFTHINTVMFRKVNSKKDGEQMGPAISNSESKKRILVISYWRSGSTFFGALIQSYPGVFYSYEPLHVLGALERMESAEKQERSVQLLRQLLQCQFSDRYFNYTVHEKFGSPTYFLSANSQVLEECEEFNSSLCKKPELYSQVCARYAIHLMKIVRLPLNATRQLIDEFTGTDLKIVYLARDPRGTMASRIGKLFCVNPSCTEASQLCQQMRNDVEDFDTLKQQFPNIFYKLKFEDLAANVVNETTKLFDFLGLEVTASVEEFISSHTKSADKKQRANPFSTVRDTQSVSSAWKNVLNQTAISAIANSCADVLKALNYEY